MRKKDGRERRESEGPQQRRVRGFSRKGCVDPKRGALVGDKRETRARRKDGGG